MGLLRDYEPSDAIRMQLFEALLAAVWDTAWTLCRTITRNTAAHREEDFLFSRQGVKRHLYLVGVSNNIQVASGLPWVAVIPALTEP